MNILAILIVCSVGVAWGQSDDVRYWLDKIFGTTLRNTFASDDTLHLALNQTKAKVEKDPNLQVFQFICSKYEKGAELARSLRANNEQEDYALIPFLVNQEENLMCFIEYRSKFSSNETNAEDNQYKTFFQETLKIHNSVTNFISDEYYEADLFPTFVFTARYRQEYFGEKPYTDGSKSREFYQQQLKKLQDYAFSSYESFFWTAMATVDYFENVPEPKRSSSQFLTDYARHLGWRDAQNYLNEARNKAENKDPCVFNGVGKHSEITEGKIAIKMHFLSDSITDKRLIRSCLGYLTSTFAQDPAVHHISMRMSAELMNYRTRSIQQTATVGSNPQSAPYTAAGLRGDGQIITVADTGADSFSCYFYDPQGQVPPTDVAAPRYDLKYRKIIQYNYNGCGAKIDAPAGHGSHVSGTAAGGKINANVFEDGMYDGVAPNAKLSISSLGTPSTGLCVPSINQLYGPGYLAGSRVHSNSWGSYFNGNRFYTDQDTDQYLFTHQSANILFAAGNAGNNGDGSYTTTTEANSKNVIAVGSSQTTLGSQDIAYVAFYSSKGPTYDNRIKPELVSPGDALLSTSSAGNGQQTCSTIQMTGTSMATPSAAGAAALIRQYFIDPNRQFWQAVCNQAYPSCRSFAPSGVLIKAIMIHSGIDMKLFAGGGSKNVQLGPSPDFMQGFGRIGFMNALPLKNVYQNFDLFIADAINIKENQQLVGRVSVSNSNVPLRATISWYDPPNIEGTTTKALLNNLDLSLISPSQQIYYPNSLSAPDRVNNNERIIIKQPQAGTWQVKIQSFALPVTGNQLFSLVITSGGRVSGDFPSILEQW